MKRIGILYHPKIERAKDFSLELEKFLSAQGVSFWTCSAWESERARLQVAGTDLILSVGGDGTILRAARIVVTHTIPIVGINLGNLGFMTELKVTEALDKLLQFISGKGWIEERAMLEVNIMSQSEKLHALNDIFVGRGKSARLVSIEAKIDGEVMTTYRADGVIVATATGSTSYSLAAGGPILYPQAKEILLRPVCPHLTLDKALVLSAETTIGLKVTTTHEAILSCDGQVELPLNSGDEVAVKVSPYVTRFLRIRPKACFYSSLESRLKSRI